MPLKRVTQSKCLLPLDNEVHTGIHLFIFPLPFIPSGPSFTSTFPLLSVDLPGNQPGETLGVRSEQEEATGHMVQACRDSGACPGHPAKLSFLGQSKEQLPDCSFHGHWTNEERPVRFNWDGHPRTSPSILLTLGMTSSALGPKWWPGAIFSLMGHSQPVAVAGSVFEGGRRR